MLAAIAAMNALEPPDVHHLRAACGWLLLGDDTEAAADLKRIDPQLHSHPDVLEVSWQIHAKAQLWNKCLDIASAIVEVDPTVVPPGHPVNALLSMADIRAWDKRVVQS